MSGGKVWCAKMSSDKNPQVVGPCFFGVERLFMVPIWIFRKRNGKECPCPFAKVRNPANPLSRFDGVPCTQRT